MSFKNIYFESKDSYFSIILTYTDIDKGNVRKDLPNNFRERVKNYIDDWLFSEKTMNRTSDLLKRHGLILKSTSPVALKLFYNKLIRRGSK